MTCRKLPELAGPLNDPAIHENAEGRNAPAALLHLLVARIEIGDKVLRLHLTAEALLDRFAGGQKLNHGNRAETGEGNDETISALSNIFTQTLGSWAVWIFSIGAFMILFSTVLSGVGAGGLDVYATQRGLRRDFLG